jgi:broad specificity phosphatase PhoE
MLFIRLSNDGSRLLISFHFCRCTRKKMKHIQNRFTFASASIIAMVLMMTSAMAASEDTVIFLVRHAEKTEAKDDPALSAAGRQRSRQLANLLSDAEIDHIYSTDFNRTRETAAPIAAMTGLDVELYTWDNPARLAQSLQQDGKRLLVVGHSNTTTELVTLLGGEPGTEIEESSEYDRLYILTINPGNVTTLLLRYGSEYLGSG